MCLRAVIFMSEKMYPPIRGLKKKKSIVSSLVHVSPNPKTKAVIRFLYLWDSNECFTRNHHIHNFEDCLVILLLYRRIRGYGFYFNDKGEN